MSSPSTLRAVLAAGILMSTASAATVYWDGSGTSWADVASWTTDPANPLADPQMVPGSADDVVFSSNAVNVAQTVNLNGDQAVGSLTVNSVGGVSITRGNADAVLTLLHGMTVGPDAAPLTIGANTFPPEMVTLSLGGNQTWTNNNGGISSSGVIRVNNVVFAPANNQPAMELVLGGNTPAIALNTIVGSISESGSAILSLTVAASAPETRWRLMGANTYRGTTHINSGALQISPPEIVFGRLLFSTDLTSNTYTGATIIKGGTLEVSKLANGGFPSGIGSSPSDASNLVLDGGALEVSFLGGSTDRLFTLGPGGGTLAATRSMTFTNLGQVALSGTNTPRTLTLRSDNAPIVSILTPSLGDNGTGATSLQMTGLPFDGGEWSLRGANTYSGGTTVLGGILSVSLGGTFGIGDVSVARAGTAVKIEKSAGDAIANTATLSLAGDGFSNNIATSGYAYLASGVNEVVGGLVLDGVLQLEPGTYGSSSSSATHISNDYFQGSGVITLIPEPSTVFTLLSGLGMLVGAQRIRRQR
jgi:autotransporter-associated beta strand protein